MTSDSKLASEIEMQFVEAFVHPMKKERLRHFFKTRKNRWKGLGELQHFDPTIFDSSVARPICSNQSNPVSIVTLMRDLGAPDECYVFSNWKKIDGLFMKLEDAITQVHRLGVATLVSSIPGKLVFFEGECFPDEYILWRGNDVRGQVSVPL